MSGVCEAGHDAWRFGHLSDLIIPGFVGWGRRSEVSRLAGRMRAATTMENELLWRRVRSKAGPLARGRLSK